MKRAFTAGGHLFRFRGQWSKVMDHSVGYLGMHSIARLGIHSFFWLPILLLQFFLHTACRFDPSGTTRVTQAAVDASLRVEDAYFSSATAIIRDRDGRVDASACGPSLFSSPEKGQLSAPRTSTQIPVEIDGKTDDWRCAAFLDLKDRANAETTAIHAHFSIQWDAENLYVLFKVIDALVEGDNASDYFKNDSVELYLDGDGVLLGIYQPEDHQLVFDHRGKIVDYGPETAKYDPPGVSAAANTTPDGYLVEIRISRAALGRAAATFKEGDTLGIDLAVNDSDGKVQNKTVLWLLRETGTYGCPCKASQCCCGNTNGKPLDLPWCNTMHFGTLVLAP